MALNKIAIEKEMVASEAAPINDDYSSAALDRGYEVDVLSQLKANLQQVEDLNSRLRFVLGEVSGIMKRH